MFSPFFMDDPFMHQPRVPRNRSNVPFFIDEDYDQVPAYSRRPQRQVPVQPQRSSPNAGHQPQKQAPPRRTVPIQSQRSQKQSIKPRSKLPDLETCHRAVAIIQRVFRGYQVRKLQVIPKLKQFSKVEKEFNLLNLKFQHVAEVLGELLTKNTEQIDFANYRITHKNLLECEEEMIKKLISLDSISSGQSTFIRTTRKQIVEAITTALQALEPLKKNGIQKLHQLQEYHAWLEQQKLAEQARQLEEQNVNSKVETKEVLSENPFSEDEISSQEEAEDLPTISDAMEKESIEESSPQEVVVEDVPSVSPPNSLLKTFDQVTLASLCFQTIQNLLEKQARLLQEKDHTIKVLQSRIEQLEYGSPAVPVQ